MCVHIRALGHRYHKVIKGVPFFRALEEGAIIKLCGLLKPFCAMQDDLIYKRGEVGREMYVLMNGNVQISFTDSATKNLSPGQTFGEGTSSLCFLPYVPAFLLDCAPGVRFLFVRWTIALLRFWC